MSFIQRERDKIARLLDEGVGDPRYPEYYAAQQALAWASDPMGFASPYQYLTGEKENSAEWGTAPLTDEQDGGADVEVH